MDRNRPAQPRPQRPAELLEGLPDAAVLLVLVLINPRRFRIASFSSRAFMNSKLSLAGTRKMPLLHAKGRGAALGPRPFTQTTGDNT